MPTLLHGPGCNFWNGMGCPLVVHYWADLQPVHGFRCYDNIHVCKRIALCTANAYSAEREMSASACTDSMPAGLIMSRVFIDNFSGRVEQSASCVCLSMFHEMTSDLDVRCGGSSSPYLGHVCRSRLTFKVTEENIANVVGENSIEGFPTVVAPYNHLVL